MIRDFTKILLGVNRPFVPEQANCVWVAIIDLEREDWGIGRHTDSLGAYDRALDTLGTELKPQP